MAIVLGRIDVEQVWTGNYDAFWEPVFEPRLIARACLWALTPRAGDMARARAYAPSEGYRVFTSDADNPMADVRATLLREA